MENTTVEDDNMRAPPHYREGGPPQVVTSDTARQGPKGSRVLVILLCSLVAICVAFGVVQLAFTQTH